MNKNYVPDNFEPQADPIHRKTTTHPRDIETAQVFTMRDRTLAGLWIQLFDDADP